MSVAGFGFRTGATAESLKSALEAALEQSGTPSSLTALATAWDKAAAPEFLRFAAELDLPVIAVPADILQMQQASTTTHIPARYGRCSLAESCALAAAGPRAQLPGPRCVSMDRMATAAIAIPENTHL